MSFIENFELINNIPVTKFQKLPLFGYSIGMYTCNDTYNVCINTLYTYLYCIYLLHLILTTSYEDITFNLLSNEIEAQRSSACPKLFPNKR